MKGTATKYGRLAVSVHWISALLLIALWPMGFSMTRMVEGATKTRLYQAHVAIALVVLLLTAVRIVWHFMDTVPDPPPNLTPLNEKAFLWNHNLLYLVLVLMVLSGIAILLTSGLGLSPSGVVPEAIAEVPSRTAHGLLSWAFLLLLLAHIGGVVRYQLLKGNTLARMGVPVSRR